MDRSIAHSLAAVVALVLAALTAILLTSAVANAFIPAKPTVTFSIVSATPADPAQH
jgi:hypothetical protein